jgi:hypothetical protein
MAHLNSPNGHKDFIQDPVPYVVNGEDTFAMRMGVPIINNFTNEVFGIKLLNLFLIKLTNTAVLKE